MQIVAYTLARFSEPSSYAGLGALLALAGIHFSDNDLGPLAQFLAAGCALAALLLKERGVIQMLALMVLAATTLGACTSPGAPENLLEDAILSALNGIDVPIAFGLRSGHVSKQNVTLIFGIEAELSAGNDAQLALLEPAVQS